MSLGIALLALAIGPCNEARADEPVLLSIEAGAIMPVASPQFERFGPGPLLGLALHTPIAPWLAPVIRARGLLLSDGPAPTDATLADPAIGLAYGLTLGLRMRFDGFADPGPARGTGWWLEANAGGAMTGEIPRPFFEAGLGVSFAVGDVSLGPSARFSHLLHFDDPIDGSSAYMASLGLELVLFDRRGEIAPTEVAEPGPGDRDRDGLLDPDDGCPDEPEDLDGFEDADGCPERDNDRDGVLDPDDGCPIEPEDLDGFRDEDGCPELDNDRDGLLDPLDRCPDEAEVINGVDDEDGCPDVGLIEMVDDRVVLEDHVLFEFERARVRSAARPVLRAIIELWRQHPDWARIMVEGHADARGPHDFNLELSHRRALRVREALIELGMPAETIEVAGYGATTLRDEGETEEAHQRNRRVEFVVVRAPAEEPGAEDGGEQQTGAGESSRQEAAQAPDETSSERDRELLAGGGTR